MRGDRLAAAVALVFSLIYLGLALRIPPSPFAAAIVGPRVLPVTIGMVLVAASLALLIQALRKEVPTPVVQDEETGAAEALEASAIPVDPVRLGVVILILVAYLFLFVPLGYVISTFLFILSMTMYLDRRHWVRNLVYAVVFPLVVYLLFTEVLEVLLPRGPLGVI